jgi:hypothetical protein
MSQQIFVEDYAVGGISFIPQADTGCGAQVSTSSGLSSLSISGTMSCVVAIDVDNCVF